MPFIKILYLLLIITPVLILGFGIAYANHYDIESIEANIYAWISISSLFIFILSLIGVIINSII